MHVESGGRGECVFLLLHGLGATGAVWVDLCKRIDAMALGRWMVVDLPGHGASEHREHYSIGRLAADLAPLLTDEARPYLVGHSLGAYIALALASGWFRVHAAGVLGVGPKITWTAADLDGVRDLAARPQRVFATQDEAIERYRKVSGLDARFARPDVLARGVTCTERGYGLAADPRAMLVAGAPFATLASSATCPVILARGEHDPMVSLAELRDHGGEALDITGRGHNAHVEDPQAVAGLCERVTRRA